MNRNNEIQALQVMESNTSEIMGIMKNDLAPAIAENLLQNMPHFVECYKQIKTLQIERQHELEMFVVRQGTQLEKFKMVVDNVNCHLNEQMQMISKMASTIMNVEPKNDEELRSKELSIKALRDLQNMFLSEMHLLLNM